MRTNKQAHNWLIDAALFVGLLLAFWMELTGVAVHQWLGVAIVVGAGYHLLTHWTWVKSVTARFFTQTSEQARQYYFVDVAVLIGLATITVTGLIISTWLNLTLTNFAVWKTLHIVASISTLLAVVVKISLHWRWIISTARRHILPKAEPGAELKAAPVTAVNSLGRREFLRLMGGVSTLAVIATISAAAALKQTAVSAASNASIQTATSVTTSGATTPTTAELQTTTSCAVRCNRRCAYPGQCRRYVDSNGNGRCDNGECA